MEDYRYSLTKKGKCICPACGRRTYVLYINNITGDPIHSTVGKCDRSDNCGHHYSPKQYFADNHISFDRKTEFSPNMRIATRPQQKPQPSFIDEALFKRTLTNYDQNNFVKWLSGIVGHDKAVEAIKRYQVGTSKDGGTVFWQMDTQGRIRTGKIIHYGSDGHRRKDILPVQWAHNLLKLPDFNLCQCLFGEHLLSDKSKPVAICESEKTAVIASCYLPGMIWVACGGCQNLSMKICEPLLGGTVVLFPDAGQYDKWSTKAKELSEICSVSVSSLIEEKATDEERKAGFDLADYLIRFSLSDFAEKKQPEVQSKQNASYVSDAGILYIPTPPDGRTTYTVYPSIDTYNKRLKLPEIVPYQSVCTSGMRQVFINLNTLTI